MKRTVSRGQRIIGVISAWLCLLGLLFPLSLRAEPAKPLIFGFQMALDMYYIGVVQNDGTPLKRYSENGFSLHPSFSPDGRSVFFYDWGASKYGRILQIYQMDLESRKLTPISDGSAVDEWPVCSPDGKHLAFLSRLAEPVAKPAEGQEQEYGYRVYISDISGKNRRVADPDGPTPQYFPNWSPDGKKLIYTHAKFLVGSRLMIRDLEKKTTTRLLPFYIFACQPAWSPKGDRIVYTGMSPISQTRSIWVVNADGTNRQQLTEGPDDQNPFWYPDGSQIMFSRNRGRTAEGKLNREICSIDLKTREVKNRISIENGSLDCPCIVAAPAAPQSRKISQSPTPGEVKKQ